ncbi:MAG: hypothetical protein FWE19_01145 [Oscillospiraceae bacterium]|nr:hypothetical protein [Oscillospiraceae bacterium]
MPWCPKCKAEYRDGFAQCSDCEVELMEERPEEIGDPPAKEVAASPILLELGTRSWMLASVAFMFAFDGVSRNLPWRLFEFIEWFLTRETRETFDMFRFSGAPQVLNTFIFPTLFNLLFFCGVFFILHKRNPLSYLTLRNVLLCAAITVGIAQAQRLFSLLMQFLLYGGDQLQFLIDNNFNYEPGILTRVFWPVAWYLLKFLDLALIYRFTIGGLSLKQLTLSKTAIGAIVIAAVLVTTQIIYFSTFFDFSFTPPDIAMRDHTVWLWRLHLLWVGLLLRPQAAEAELPADPPEPESEPAEDAFATEE